MRYLITGIFCIILFFVQAQEKEWSRKLGRLHFNLNVNNYAVGYWDNKKFDIYYLKPGFSIGYFVKKYETKFFTLDFAVSYKWQLGYDYFKVYTNYGAEHTMGSQKFSFFEIPSTISFNKAPKLSFLVTPTYFLPNFSNLGPSQSPISTSSSYNLFNANIGIGINNNTNRFMAIFSTNIFNHLKGNLSRDIGFGITYFLK